MAVKKKTKAIILAAVCVLIVAAIALSSVLIYRSTPQFALNEAGKYIDMGDYKSAIIALEEALIKFPDNADIRLALSEAYELSGDIENALRVLTEYFEMYDVPESRRNEVERRIVELGGSIDSAFGAITSGGATRNNDPGQDTDSTTASDLNNTVVYSSDNVPAELMGEPPASAEEVVQMINDYLQYGTELDTEAMKYVTYLYIIGNNVVRVGFDSEPTDISADDLLFSSEPHDIAFDNEGKWIIYDTVFELYKGYDESQPYELCEWGKLSDISFICRNFPNLHSLRIRFNRISDISTIGTLSSLSYLDLSYNKISDISPLKELNSNGMKTRYAFSGLLLDGNDISDVSVLKELTDLYDLSACQNPISFEDISELEDALYNCHIITDKDLYGATGTNTTEDNKNLDQSEAYSSEEEIVQMINDYIQHGTNLDKEKLKNVTSVGIFGNKCLGVGINGNNKWGGNILISPHYDVYDKYGTRIKSDTLFEVYKIDDYGNVDKDSFELLQWGAISDISFISEYFPSLTSLCIEFNKLADLTPLAEMKQITEITVPYNEIIDISPLSGMKHMVYLDISYNKVADITAIAGMKDLNELLLWGNDINDLTPLYELPNFTKGFINDLKYEYPNAKS